MKLTKDNYIEVIPVKDQALVESLISEVNEINDKLIIQNDHKRTFYIDYIIEHTEYSPERVDPCPDYYGMYTLRFYNDESETIGIPMTLTDLDSSMCMIYDFVTLLDKM